MYPIALASLITVAVAVERYRTYQRAQSDMTLIKTHLPALMSQKDDEAVKALCEKAGGVVGQMLVTAVEHRTHVVDMAEFLSGQAQEAAGKLKENLNYVSAVVTLSPLMGLLGTVTGMIHSFDVLGMADGEPFAVTGGVAEALIATAFGLLVAILAMVVYVWLQQLANRRIADIEAGATLYLTMLKR